MSTDDLEDLMLIFAFTLALGLFCAAAWLRSWPWVVLGVALIVTTWRVDRARSQRRAGRNR